jgi:hypothetical protein
VQHILEEIWYGCVMYEDQPVPSSIDAREFERLMEDGYLKWQSVIWSSMRIAVLTRKGQEAMR